MKPFPIKMFWFKGRLTRPYPLEYHHEVECQFVKHGRGKYLINGNVNPFGANSFILILPDEVHSLIPPSAGYLEKGALLFPPALLKSDLAAIAQRLQRSQTRVFEVPEPDLTQMEIIFRRICDETAYRKPDWQRMVNAKLIEMIILFKRYLEQPQPAPPGQLTAQLAAHLEAHYAEPIRVTDLAGRFGYALTYLSRLFKKEIGCGIKQFVLQRRILEAKRLLETEPALKLSAVAERAGFSDLAAFSAYFKAIVKVSPGVYRKFVRNEGRKKII